MSNEREPWHMRVVVFIITRLVYFVIGFFLLPVGSAILFRRSFAFVDPFTFFGVWQFWLVYLAIGIVVAIFGPSAYTMMINQGRGSLDEIRRKSGLRGKNRDR